MKNETIVDRVVERLKRQPLGDLITEEDLHEVVKQAVPKAFFEVRRSNDGYRTIEKEPAIVEILRELLREAAKDATERWMRENAPAVADYWKKVCDDGLAAYVQKVQDEKATSTIREMLTNWIVRMNEQRSRDGLPLIYP